MSYLQDKKHNRKKYLKIFLFSIGFLFLVIFQKSFFHVLAIASNAVFKPIIFIGDGIGDKLSNLGSYFKNKKSVDLENQRLSDELNEKNAKLSNYDSLQKENLELKETLGRIQDSESFILGSILSKPNKSLFDTLVLDVGSKDGVMEGNVVFAKGEVPIGKISEVFSNSSKVTLFSSGGEKTEIILSDNKTFLEIIGRGGGNFELNVPRDFEIKEGEEAVLPGLVPYVVAKVERIISDPRDSFIKVLLVSPVNIQAIKFVEIKIK